MPDEEVTEESSDQAYFHAVETLFIELRGAPLLLSPADWRITRGWREAGIPIDLVREALETVFRRREERGTKGKVQSLRYCRDAVESSWEEFRELSAPGDQKGADTVDVDKQMAQILRAFPENETIERLGLKERIAAIEGSLSERETELQALEAELYRELEHDQGDEERESLEQRILSVLATLPEPLAGAERERATERLRRQILRRRNGLPVLSLFS